MPRRFPPPWSVEESDACFISRDAKHRRSPLLLSPRNNGRVSVVSTSRSNCHGNEQSAARLRAKAQPAQNQDDGPKALDETQSQDWRIYGSEESREVQIGSSGKERQIACMMPPVITSIKPELRSKGLDRRQCCWHVSYRFCGLSAEITVYAENEAETRAKAVDQLRLRGLKVVA